MTYRGSCHCGNVAYEVEGEIGEAYACNCSMCSRKGSLLWFAPMENFRLLRGENALTTYKFHKQVIEHRFCNRCGIHSFAQGVDPQGNRMAAINIRCLEGFDIDKVAVKRVNGRDF